MTNQLSDEEHVFLTAAAQGDVPIIRQSLEAALQALQPTDIPDDTATGAARTISGTRCDDENVEGCNDDRRLYRKRVSVSAAVITPRLNIDCVDYMGRSALHLAVDR